MVKRFSQWKRLLAAFLTLVMLFSNNVGVLEAFAEGEEATTNLELNARVIVNNDDGVVDAGEKFQYELQYTVPNLTGSKYTGARLTFRLPKYVELETNSEGKYVITGSDFDSIIYKESITEYVYKANIVTEKEMMIPDLSNYEIYTSVEELVNSYKK